MSVPRKILVENLKRILVEDIGQGDVTVQAVIPQNLTITGIVVSKEAGVACGLEESATLGEYLGLRVDAKVADGDKIEKNQVLLEISGDARTILSTERTMLNLISRMSGIATTTRMLSEKLKKAGAKGRIAATRKSAPGLLFFDKKAVTVGGGDPHRLHLDDMVLIKDNHLALVGNVETAVARAKENASFTKKIEVEVTRTEDALKAAKAGADIIMFDNFSPQKAKDAAQDLSDAGFGYVLLEVSGGITNKNLLEFAQAQVDIISLGELTHSVKALDISLEIKKD
jgi:nicotinate-nucleotide pyrophosphorylase (carboxylating)